MCCERERAKEREGGINREREEVRACVWKEHERDSCVLNSLFEAFSLHLVCILWPYDVYVYRMCCSLCVLQCLGDGPLLRKHLNL